MKILLDTNFILTCIKQKVDFISLADKLFDEDVEWLIPIEVLKELKELSKRKGMKIRDKEAAKLSLKIVKKIKSKKIKLGSKNVDQGIVNYTKSHNVVLATLDRELKKHTNAKVLTIRRKKSLELIN